MEHVFHVSFSILVGDGSNKPREDGICSVLVRILEHTSDGGALNLTPWSDMIFEVCTGAQVPYTYMSYMAWMDLLVVFANVYTA